MDDNRNDKAGASFAILAVLFIAAIAVAYPLSAGPAEWAIGQGYLGGGASEFCRAFYSPLTWLYQHADWFKRLADWYMSWWR